MGEGAGGFIWGEREGEDGADDFFEANEREENHGLP